MFRGATLYSNNSLVVVMPPMPTKAESTVNFKQCQVFVGNLQPSQDVSGTLSLSLSLSLTHTHTHTHTSPCFRLKFSLAKQFMKISMSCFDGNVLWELTVVSFFRHKLRLHSKGPCKVQVCGPAFFVATGFSFHGRTVQQAFDSLVDRKNDRWVRCYGYLFLNTTYIYFVHLREFAHVWKICVCFWVYADYQDCMSVQLWTVYESSRVYGHTRWNPDLEARLISFRSILFTVSLGWRSSYH